MRITSSIVIKWARSRMLHAFILAHVFLLPINVSLAGTDSTYECGGVVETEVWNLWDHNVSIYLNHWLLQERLLKQGDVWALYDFQTYTHNVVSMARRCDRTNRLRKIAALIDVAYKALEGGTSSSPGRRWVCRGGRRCSDKNRMINTEVKLCSLQFLGVASSTANALALSEADLSDDDKAFVNDTVQIVLEHLLRWSNEQAVHSIQQAKNAKPQDINSGSSALFFTDKPLWLITIYAELAGILQSQGNLDLEGIPSENRAQLALHLNELLQFFSARTSMRHVNNERLGEVDLADIDRGYWRRYIENRYAGYERTEKPVVCVYSGNDKNKFQLEVRVPPDRVPLRKDIGWDISHARRFVHALDALERNRQALKNLFHLKEEQLPLPNITIAFANTLVSLVWNGDKEKPLFSNYWSGANGWFRVGYDNGTGQCREGIPPYGLTFTFLSGGYITWARYQPIIGMLGQRLYELISHPDGGSSAFILKYYSRFSKSASPQNKVHSKFKFLPSLVGVINKGGGVQSPGHLNVKHQN